jgi:hypothetical protein
MDPRSPTATISVGFMTVGGRKVNGGTKMVENVATDGPKVIDRHDFDRFCDFRSPSSGGSG